MADLRIIVLLCFCALSVVVDANEPNYVIGAGIYDITGPAGRIPMMGFAKPSMTTQGIHQRLYARAFVIAEITNPSQRAVFVSCDIGMASQLVTIEVMSKLKERFGGIYSENNVIISGTHTHSGPGGYLQYALYALSVLGFLPESFDVIVDGIVESITLAHGNMQPGFLYINRGELYGTNINRSPTSYLRNPQEERARYEFDTDKTMLILKMLDANNEGIGLITWFAVHPVSMNNTNHVISGDNKGYASYLFEKQMNPADLPGTGKFVAAFASSNLGDVSPNTRGPRCQDTGEFCDMFQSTCNGRNQLCIASGPGKDMIESTEIIGANQFRKAWELWESATQRLTGKVDFRHQFIDMTSVDVTYKNGMQGSTCKPAMGYSFAAGTTDGPGAFNFSQGMTEENEFWSNIVDTIKPPTDELEECHAPKPILLATGEANTNLKWQPDIVELNIMKIGQLVITAVPGEFTTMAGRRLRESVTQTLITHGYPEDTCVVIAGLSGTYSSYIVTYEEYQAQRYEAASTIYGPHTLQAYIEKMNRLAEAMALGEYVPKGQLPPNMTEYQLTIIGPPRDDEPPRFGSIGDVLFDARETYYPGDVVKVKFQAGNPRNDLMTEKTFLTVDYHPDGETSQVVLTDSNWETMFEWEVTSLPIGAQQSEATVTWNIPEDVQLGEYSITHYGHHRSTTEDQVTITPYQGTTKRFQIVERPDYYFRHSQWKKRDLTFM